MRQATNIIITFSALVSTALGQAIIMENGPVSSTVTVSVILPAKAMIVSSSHPAPIAITVADVRNGSKYIPAAGTLTIWSNAGNGFLLRSRLASLKAGNGAGAAGIIVLARVSSSSGFQPQFSDFQDLYQGAKAEKNLSGHSFDLQLLIGPGTTPGLYQLEPEFSVTCL
jgi:hypothetical protein